MPSCTILAVWNAGARSLLPWKRHKAAAPGWVTLTYSPRDKRWVKAWAADHTTTLAGGDPVLVLDM
jgi:hypothetical protein